MPRTLYLFTGGTISMSIDPIQDGAIPTLTGHEILAFVPSIPKMTEPELIDVSRLPGPHVTPELMWELSELVNRHLERPEIDGIVITHGTDTLEETAYMLDLRLTSQKPVVVVGALRNSSELSWDGPANLEGATRVVLDPVAAGQGVFVALNESVHAASEATKTDTQASGTFQSPIFGPLALIEQDRIFWRRRLTSRRTVAGGPLEPRVDMFTMYSGFDPRLLQYAIDSGAQGLVLEGTGRGNAPPAIMPALDRAREAAIPVVLATRCWHGRVLDTYGYAGSGKDMRKRGVIFAGTVNGQKARVHLMLALGKTRSVPEIQSMLEQDLY